MEGLIVLYVAVGVYLIWCFCKIAEKAGYSRWFGVLMIIPLVNFVILGICAFETWPVLKPVKQRRAEKISSLRSQLAELGYDYLEYDKKETIEELTNSCPSCGKEISEIMKFCPQCGRKLKTQ